MRLTINLGLLRLRKGTQLGLFTRQPVEPTRHGGTSPARLGPTPTPTPTPTPPPPPLPTPTPEPRPAPKPPTPPTPPAKFTAVEKEYRAAVLASHKASEARRNLPAGSSRAAVTTANARWMNHAENRDRLEKELDPARAKAIARDALAALNPEKAETPTPTPPAPAAIAPPPEPKPTVPEPDAADVASNQRELGAPITRAVHVGRAQEGDLIQQGNSAFARYHAKMGATGRIAFHRETLEHTADADGTRHQKWTPDGTTLSHREMGAKAEHARGSMDPGYHFKWGRAEGAPARPPGYGWTPVPHSIHGSFRRLKPGGGGWDYWYPDKEAAKAAKAHHEEAEKVARARTLESGVNRNSDESFRAANEADQHRSALLGARAFLGESESGEPTPTIPRPTPKPLRPPTPPTPPVPVVSDEAPILDNSGRRVHHDVGEKVKGAKKWRWEQVHSGNLETLEAEGDAAAAKHVTKSTVLGETSGESDQALGSTAGAASLKREVRKMISAKPTIAGMDPKKARAAYVEGVEWLREALDKCKTVADIEQLRDETKWMADGGGTYSEEIPLTEESGRDFAARYPRRPGSSTSLLYPRGPDGKHIKGPGANGADLCFELDTDRLSAAGYKIHHGRGGTSIRKLDARQKPYGAWFASMGPRILVVFGSGAYSDSTLSTWHMHVRDGRQREETNDWTGLLASENTGAATTLGDKQRLDVHKELGVRRRGTLERIGGKPIPKNTDGASLTADFGLRAVQYGNWIDDDSASKHIDACHGALSDLSDVIGVDPKMLAHGSKLAIAFGARGSGNANAHYETGEQIINLTATRGGGTLAHEWAHFIDHMLPGELFYSPTPWGKEASWGSHGRSGRLSGEAVEAYRGVMHALQYGNGGRTGADPVAMEAERAALKRMRKDVDTAQKAARIGQGDPHAAAQALRQYMRQYKDFNTKARAGEGGKRPQSKFLTDAATLGEYWARPHEMFARAFESYVEDKLENGGRRNTYLVSGTRQPMRLTKAVNGESKTDLEIYPQAGERQAIAKAFDHFFAVMNRTGAMKKALGALGIFPVRPGTRIIR